MSALPPDADDPTVADDLRRAADAAGPGLRAAVDGQAGRLGSSILGRVRRAASYGQALEVAEQELARLRALTLVVESLAGEVRDLQARQLEADPFGDAWREVVRAEQAQTDAAARQAAWTARYAAAFVAGQFEACAWLSRDEAVRPEEASARGMLAAARAAAEGDLAGTVPALDRLIRAEAGSLPPEVLLRCWCMWARAVAGGLGDPARARDALAELLARPDPAWPRRELGLVRAALGECLLAGEDPQQADIEARQAQRLARHDPFGFVLRGLVAETLGFYVRAHESYDDAVAAAGDRAVAGELFAPVPAGLLWRYGRRRRETAPELAVEAITRAIRAGIRGGDDWPERKAYVDLARALEAQGDPRGAAGAYWDAGRRYSWAGDEPSAVAYLRKACTLDDRTAVYRLEFAEALRLRSVRDDGTVDVDLLKDSVKSWRVGMALQEPGAEVPWAYVTGALIAHEESGDLYRPRASWPAASLLERGLLVAPDDLRLTAQLSQAHRLLGNRWTALALTQRVNGQEGDDELVFDQHLLALLDLGRHAEGLRLLDRRGHRPQEPWLVNRRVQFLLELGRPAEALELLSSSPRVDESLHDLQVALCHRLLGRPAEAGKAYQRIWERQGTRALRRRGYLAGWAGYLLDRYDDAAAIFTRLVEGDPFDASLACDLGQVLLARGRSELHDLSQGEEVLRTGVALTRSAYALTQLDGAELPLLLEKVAGAGHGGAVAEVVARVRERIAAKLADLDAVADARHELERALERAGDADDPGIVRRTALTGLARTAADGERWEEALQRYVALAADGTGDPEVAHAVRRAGLRLCRLADDLAQADGGDPGAALVGYRALLEQLQRVPSAAPELLAAAHLRAALVATRLDAQPGFAEHLTAALSPGLPGPDLDAVVASAVRTPDHFWPVVDAARSLAGGAEAEGAAAARRLLDRLDLSVVLRARQSDVDSSRLFPLATPLVVRLGEGLRAAGAQASPTVPQHLARIRAEVERDTGVRVPYMSVRPFREDEDPGAYGVDLYELPMARATVPLDHGLEDVLGHVEAVVRANLHRLFSIDDVALWLGGVGSSMADADRLTRSDRLELLRLLRLLLREQVPIVDRDAIFAVVAAAGPGWSAVDLLPAVRRRLAGRLAAPSTSTAGRPAPAALPAELEAALAEGLAGTGDGVWQLPRDQAHDLSTRLAAWHRAAGADTVVVADPRLRPFVWRLLAGPTRPSATVLDQEELDGRT
jgi:tetratricopeptide (TPR) repeat protein